MNWNIADMMGKADVIERLRECLDECKLCYEADEIERLTAKAFATGMAEAADEIERLEHMKANLHGHIKRLEDEIGRLRPLLSEVQDQRTLINSLVAENARLREALDEAAKELERDLMPFAASKARAALQKDEGDEMRVTPRNKTLADARSKG